MSRMRAVAPLQPRWYWLASIPVLAGLCWVVAGWQTGLLTGLLASIPGLLLLASGVALVLWPGDRQITHFMALGAVLGVPVAVLCVFSLGFLASVAFIALGLASLLVAGHMALVEEPRDPRLPDIDLSPGMAAKAATDEALLAYFIATANLPNGARIDRDHEEIEQATATLEQYGYLDNPAGFHETPGCPEDVEVAPGEGGGQHFEHVQFESRFQARGELPGGQRWLDREANQRMHAWMFRHADGPRPWLICVHGYRMGRPLLDFSLFNIDYLHRRLGLNLLMPVLPLHGPRKAFSRSGSGFLDGNLVDMLHAETQALWDLRRTLAWLRQQHAPQAMGLLGYSLGGYNAALLSAFEDDLDCVIAGIPLTDMADAVWQHLPLLHRRYIETAGISLADARRLLQVVSPLGMNCRVAHDRRFIFAATGDQIVPPEQAHRLWQHWGQPEMHWYQGSHLSVRRERSACQFMTAALGRGGLLPTRESGPARAGRAAGCS
ncbi:MAG: hypothetical protein CMN28_06325 [Salinisphaeraceae bacterium]|nr:hypothetical protein [Salinisphaeraceae bacterium]